MGESRRFSRFCDRCKARFVPNTPSNHLCVDCIDKARVEGARRKDYNKTFKLGQFRFLKEK